MTVKKTQQNLSTTLEKTEQTLGGLENSLGNNEESSLLATAEDREANDGLPEVWANIKLEEFALVNMGQSPKGESVSLGGDGLPFYQGKTEFGKLHPRPRKYCITPTKIAEKNDILLSVRAPVGPTNICQETSCIGRGLAGIRSYENKSQNYLHKFFLHVEPWLSLQGTGTTFKAISGGFLREVKVPLPPLAEQTVIAQTLDTLLAQVDNIKTRLDAIPKVLKTFRQSVLAAAVSGKLTEEWRGDNAYTGITQHHSAPSVWRAVNINTVIEYVTSGSRGWAAYYADEGSLFIRSQDINKDELDIVDAAYVCLPEKAEGRRTKVKKGDLLVTITGANVTKCARVKTELNDAYISQHVALIRLKDTTSANFIELVLKAGNAGRKQLTDMAYGGGKPGLNLQNIKDVEFSLPATEEQNEIVHRVKELFAFADQVEQQVKNAQGRVNNLTQSILAKAFRGELTAQWRAENPDLISGDSPENGSAELLLAKIKAEREALKQKAKPKNKTALKKAVNKK